MSLWDWVFFLPTWLNVVLVLAVAIYIYGVWPYKTNKFGYPGPPPTVLLGNMMDLFSKSVPEADKEYAKKYGDTVLVWLGRSPSLIVSDPDLVKDICIKQFPNFVNRTIVKGRIALTKVEREQLSLLEDDHWKFVRSVISPAFSSGKLRKMVPILHSCLENLEDVITDHCKQGKSVDVTKMFERFTLDAIAATAFGMDTCVQKNPDDRFVKMMDKVLSQRISPLLFLNLFFPFSAKIMEHFDISAVPKETIEGRQFIEKNMKFNIEQRKQNEAKRSDLLQLMIDAKIGEATGEEDDVDVSVLENEIQRQRKGLTESEVMAQCFVFLVAGFATTAGTLGFVAHSLAVNPECQEKLIEEIDREVKNEKPTYEIVMKLQYLDMCLAETLRIYPPAQRTSRQPKEDAVIKGHLIPKDLTVQFPIAYLQNSPKYWPEPEKFKPERFTPEEKAKRHPYVYLPFGIGPRNCVGMRLAQLEAKMAIVSILQKFRFVRSLDTEVPLKLGKRGFSIAENGIWIKMEARTDISS